MSVFLQGLDRNANDKAIQDIFANLSIEATVERQNNKRFAIAKLADESKVNEAVEAMNGNFSTEIFVCVFLLSVYNFCTCTCLQSNQKYHFFFRESDDPVFYLIINIARQGTQQQWKWAV